MEDINNEKGDLYSFEIEDCYEAKKRMPIFASIDIHQKLTKLGEKNDLTKNMMALKIITEVLEVLSNIANGEAKQVRLELNAKGELKQVN